MVEPYVLIVDDDKPILDLIAERLETAGYRVTTASDAWQALVQAGGLKLGLVITDIMLSGIGTGTDTFKRLRKAYPKLPVIFITSMPGPAARDKVPNDPLVRLVLKPIKFDELRQAIKELTKVDRPF